MSARRKRQIAVIGGNGIEEGSETWTLAEEVGRGLAEAGVAVVCGGGGGVMEAASRAAAEAGGDVIGIVPGAPLPTTPTPTAATSSPPASAMPATSPLSPPARR